jgi:hypothetical protein
VTTSASSDAPISPGARNRGRVVRSLDISDKAPQAYQQQGVAMGAAQAGKTAAKHAAAWLWLAVGVSVAVTIASGGILSGPAGAAIVSVIGVGGTHLTHEAIDELTPHLRSSGWATKPHAGCVRNEGL